MFLCTALVIAVVGAWYGLNHLKDRMTTWAANTVDAPTSPVVLSDRHFVLFDSIRGDNSLEILKVNIQTGNRSALTPEHEGGFNAIASSQGGWIAFARKDRDGQHIWLMNSDGTSKQQITQGSVVDLPVTFSRDGSMIYFVRTTPRLMGALPDSQILEIRTNAGGSPALIGDGVSVSADASTLALSRFDASAQQPRIILHDRISGSERDLGFGYLPTFSTDGHQVAFLRSSPDYSVEVIVNDLITGKAAQLRAPHGFKTGPRYSTDGEAITFRIPSSPRDGPGGLFIVDLRSGESSRILDIDGESSPIFKLAK